MPARVGNTAPRRAGAIPWKVSLRSKPDRRDASAGGVFRSEGRVIQANSLLLGCSWPSPFSGFLSERFLIQNSEILPDMYAEIQRTGTTLRRGSAARFTR